MTPEPAPLSKTAKYKKITKPLLERKRRARINRCLDELKDLMVGALEIDDDNLSKLEKADILELTVNHLTKLHRPKDPVLEAKKFQAGFGQCAAEACRFIMSIPDLDSKVSQNLVGHLSRLITSQPLSIQVPERPSFSPPGSPSSMLSDRHHYYSDHDRSSSDAEDFIYSSENMSRQGLFARTNKVSSGLLTTVDKVLPGQHESTSTNGNKNTYFNRVPIEAKDMILQKIRQHIMDKRGNENIGNVESPHQDIPEANVYEEKVYNYQNSSPRYAYNDTLDLRKFRSPTKPAEISQTPKSPVAKAINIEEIEKPIEIVSTPPERCELAMDYSNLPPKKKRKLIEYQEFKKQEEAKRQHALFAEQKEHIDRPPTCEDPKWAEYKEIKRQEEIRHKLCALYANQMEPSHGEWSEHGIYAYYAKQKNYPRDRPPVDNEGEKWRPW